MLRAKLITTGMSAKPIYGGPTSGRVIQSTHTLERRLHQLYGVLETALLCASGRELWGITIF